ncbi:MAG: hypothetical protein ABIN24_03255, partial [Dyadobacter sp.]
IEIYASSLLKGDQLAVNDLQRNQDLFMFYKDYIPTFFNDPYSFSLGWLLSEKTKTGFLRDEYQKYLFNEKKLIIADHFRHNRTFKPKTLEASLLNHKSNCLLPDFNGFINKMDKPTKAVFQFLQHHMRLFLIQKETFISGRLNELQSFKKINFNKHYPDAVGWHIENMLPPGEEQERRAMLLLLIKFDGYDY